MRLAREIPSRAKPPGECTWGFFPDCAVASGHATCAMQKGSVRGRQRVVFLKSGQDRIHDGSPQPPLFQDADALDGGATGGADGVLQLAWMVSRGQKQGGGTQEHLRSVAVGVFPGQAAGYAAIGQGLQELADKGRAAACHGAGGVQQGFWQPVQLDRRGPERRLAGPPAPL